MQRPAWMPQKLKSRGAIALSAVILVGGLLLFWALMPSAPADASLAARETVARQVSEAGTLIGPVQAVSESQPLAENETLVTGDAPQTAMVPSSDSCIACHTNQALLQSLAEEPEEVHSELASGEG